MHLLGLNWQLQPADGHTFNNGIRTGLPGNDDVTTAPSGGKGEVTAAARPLEATGKFRALATWFRFFNPNLVRYAKGKKRGGKKALHFLGNPVQSCLLFLSVSCVWLEPLGAGAVPAQSQVHPYALCSDRQGLELLESISRPGEQQEKVLPDGES